MGERAERLRQPPGREGVGRIALVIDRKARNETGVEQVRVELGQAFGQEHALVDDRARRQGAEIQLGYLCCDRLLLDAAADHVKIALELGGAGALGVPDHDLLDLGARRIRLLADHRDVDRHLPPAVDGVTEGKDLGLDDLPATLLRAEVGLRQENLAYPHRARLHAVAAAFDGFGEEILRDLDVDAGAIARLAVGVNRAAVPHRLQRLDPGLDDVAARLAVRVPRSCRRRTRRALALRRTCRGARGRCCARRRRNRGRTRSSCCSRLRRHSAAVANAAVLVWM